MVDPEELTDAAIAEVTRTPWRFLAIGALLYMAWTIEALVLPERFDPLTSYVSELSARDQAGSWLFRLTDATAGACIAIGAFAASLRSYAARIGWFALAGFGAATVVDTVFPMACAPSQSDACAVADRANTLGWVHTAHSVTSTTAGLLLVVAVVLLTKALVARRTRWSVPMAMIATVVCVTSIWSLAESLDQLLDASGYALVGLAQRVQLVATFAWLMGLAAMVWQRTPGLRDRGRS